MRKMFIVFYCCLFLFACDKKQATTQSSPESPSQTTLTYAEGFSVKYMGRNKLVEVKYPFQGATSGHTYLLVQQGETTPAHDPDVRVISIPLNSIVCTSTTHIPLLDYLDETDKLVGFPSSDYISSKKMRERIDSGLVTELGMDKGMNLERLAVLQPGLVMAYSMSSDYGQFKKIEELHIPVIINAEYLEKHPLGRAEWIKFMALFFNKEMEADTIFRRIEKNYNEAKALVNASTEKKPTVLSGIVYGDAWFLPGGNNYAANLFKDAGCNYLWADNPSQGYLELSFEAVYEKAFDADLWIGTGTYSSLQDVARADDRYTRFKPFQQQQVYTYDARKGAKGGSEYLELGYLRPDLILKDLIKIGHPTLLPDYDLYFHSRLQ